MPPRQGPEGQRWAALREIDYRTNVGTDAWWRLNDPQRVRHLSVHRYLHVLAEHEALPQNFENWNLNQKLGLSRRLESQVQAINQVNRNVQGYDE